uniref:Ig-like domain-containing protein n=1 Tax=Scleropages formosus TaxID=113540 RepID=A0A8C9QQD7_SCLFO
MTSETSLFLHVKSTTVVWAANVSPKITALTRSCVVIPCNFQNELEFPVTQLSGIWQTSTGGYVYHNGQTEVLDNFKGRTKIIGNMDEQNCTLEIDDVKAHDNGPFCFRAEKGENKYSFNSSCVFIIMKASPIKPVMTPLPNEIDEGTPVEATCSVTHTCPTHPPHFTWNVQGGKSTVQHVERGDGVWETSSMLMFIPYGKNFEDVLTCNATFWRGKTQQISRNLNVKSMLNVNFGIYSFRPFSSLFFYYTVPTITVLVCFLETVHGTIKCFPLSRRINPCSLSMTVMPSYRKRDSSPCSSWHKCSSFIPPSCGTDYMEKRVLQASVNYFCKNKLYTCNYELEKHNTHTYIYI